MQSQITNSLSFLNTWLFSPLATIVLLIAGVILSFRLKFFQLSNPVKLARLMFEKKGSNKRSPIRALTLALAGTLGVGNISGVAIALALGGAGAVFWMWVSAFFAMIVKYSEIVLAVHHRKTRDGVTHGGAMYYIKRGLGSNGIYSFLASSFAIFCIFSSLSTGSIIQVNAVSEAFSGCFGIPPLAVGILMALLCSFVLFSKKQDRISDITFKIVPFMSVTFIILSMIIIIGNINDIPQIINMIIEDAFKSNSAVSGIGGFLFSKGVRFGVTKGLFSNEAGCGTSTIAHASADTTSARSPYRRDTVSPIHRHSHSEERLPPEPYICIYRTSS